MGIRIQKEYIVGEIVDEEDMYREYDDSIDEDKEFVYSQKVFSEDGKPEEIVEKFFNQLNVPAAYRKHPLR